MLVPALVGAGDCRKAARDGLALEKLHKRLALLELVVRLRTFSAALWFRLPRRFCRRRKGVLVERGVEVVEGVEDVRETGVESEFVLGGRQGLGRLADAPDALGAAKGEPGLVGEGEYLLLGIAAADRVNQRVSRLDDLVGDPIGNLAVGIALENAEEVRQHIAGVVPGVVEFDSGIEVLCVEALDERVILRDDLVADRGECRVLFRHVCPFRPKSLEEDCRGTGTFWAKGNPPATELSFSIWFTWRIRLMVSAVSGQVTGMIHRKAVLFARRAAAQRRVLYHNFRRRTAIALSLP